jgi:leucyl/phenylalanyl-tRNA--protein transferase
MFSRVTDASKVALAHLVAHLIRGGYRLLDTQFVTEHLQRFGTMEISRARYRHVLAEALETPAYFPVEGLGGVEVVSVLQSSTLIS